MITHLIKRAVFHPGLLLLLLLLPSVLSAADAKAKPPPQLNGKTFNVTYPTEKGKPQDVIMFKEKTMMVRSVGNLEIPYETKWKGKESEFNGTVTNAKGAVIEVSGLISAKGEIRGSVTVRPKEGDPFAKNFSNVNAK
jgi:hypothetical protein